MESGLGIWLGLNLLITFTIPNISIGGHIGGLMGGALAALVLVELPRARRTRPPRAVRSARRHRVAGSIMVASCRLCGAFTAAVKVVFGICPVR